MKRLIKQFRYGEKGFTLVELLVVVVIVGVLAAVGVLNVGEFIGKGESEAYQVELHNVQTVVKAMLANSTAGQLDAVVTDTDDMTTVTADSGIRKLSDYLVGLDADGKIKSGCTYTFEVDGAVTQTTP